MKKIIGVSIIILTISIAIGLIPLIIFGNHTVDPESFVTGIISFFYIVVFGICILSFDIVMNFKKYTKTELPKVYQTITLILISSIIAGGLFGYSFPLKLSSPYALTPIQYFYEFNPVSHFIPIGVGIVASLIVYGKYLLRG